MRLAGCAVIHLSSGGIESGKGIASRAPSRMPLSAHEECQSSSGRAAASESRLRNVRQALRWNDLFPKQAQRKDVFVCV